MDPSPFVRTSFWTMSLGLTTTWIGSMGVDQMCVQRFLAVPDLKSARRYKIIAILILIFKILKI